MKISIKKILLKINKKRYIKELYALLEITNEKIKECENSKLKEDQLNFIVLNSVKENIISCLAKENADTHILEGSVLKEYEYIQKEINQSELPAWITAFYI